MEEIWRPISAFPYEVSNQGRVRRTKRARTSRKGKILKPGTTHAGHLTVVLYDHPRKRTAGVHRLVCEAFHGDPPTPAHEASHLDGDPKNNRPENLAWVTHAENERQKGQHGTRNIISHDLANEVRDRLRELRGNHPRAPRGSVKLVAQEFKLPLHVVGRLSAAL